MLDVGDTPDVEVVVRVRTSDVFIAGLFTGEGDSVDVVFGKADTLSVDEIELLLNQVVVALHNASWQPLLDIRLDEVGGDEDYDEFPF